MKRKKIIGLIFIILFFTITYLLCYRFGIRWDITRKMVSGGSAMARHGYDYKGRLVGIINNNKTIYKYDENDRIIEEKNNEGYKKIYRYDDKGNLIYDGDNRGYYHIYGYDKNNNLIFYNDNYNNYYRNEYNDNNELIYREQHDGKWKRYEKDENKDVIIYEGNKNEEWHTKYVYDEKEWSRTSKFYKYKEKKDGSWIKFEHDEKGKIISEEMSKDYSKDSFDEMNDYNYWWKTRFTDGG